MIDKNNQQKINKNFKKERKFDGLVFKRFKGFIFFSCLFFLFVFSTKKHDSSLNNTVLNSSLKDKLNQEVKVNSAFNDSKSSILGVSSSLLFSNSSAGTIGTNQYICVSDIPESIIELTAPIGNNINYQWQSATKTVSFSDILNATSKDYSPSSLGKTTFFRRIVSFESGTTFDTTNVVTINVGSFFIVTLQPDGIIGKDVAIQRDRGGIETSYPDSEFLYCNAWNSNGVYRSLIDFDLSFIPQTAVIESAKLSLYAYEGLPHSSHSGPNDVWIERVTSSWGEQTVVYGTQPTTTTTVNRVAIPSTAIGDMDFPNIDVKNLVEDIIANQTSSFGFMLKLQNENYFRRMNFCSSDHSNPEKRPKLEITFSPQQYPTVTTQVVETICQGEPFEFNSTFLTESGLYKDTLLGNCKDSIVELTLQVYDTVHTELSANICQGESYFFNNQSLTESGIYLDTLPTIHSCDSFVVLNLNVLDTFQREIRVAFCPNDTYFFNGQTLTQPGVYLDTLSTINGCDSFIILKLRNYQAGVIGSERFLCNGETISPNHKLVELVASNDTNSTYQWQSSVDSLNFMDISGAISADYIPTDLTKTHYFRRIDIHSSGGCLDTTNVITIPYFPALTACSDEALDISLNLSEVIIKRIIESKYGNGGDANQINAGSYTYIVPSGIESLNFYARGADGGNLSGGSG